MNNLEVGDIVMCTVDRIVGTIVFVKIDHDGEQFSSVESEDGARSGIEGSIILSEIAPGRIRNLRDYVVPKKKIVCKVLRISGDRIDLSLRRVTQKEQKEIKEQHNQEKSSESILKGILGEKAEEVIKEILKKESIHNFLQKIKENPKELEKLAGEENCKRILNILKSQKQKKVAVKKEILLTTAKPNGLELIKEILGKIKDAEIKYISAGRYIVKTESADLKTADNKLKEILNKIEKMAEEQDMAFQIKEK